MDLPAIIALCAIVCLGMVGCGFGCYMWGFARGKEDTDLRYQLEREHRAATLAKAVRETASAQSQREKDLQKTLEGIQSEVASVGPNPTADEIKLLLERVRK